jgi:ribosomal protein S18 acetylase RimI-like enzyme
MKITIRRVNENDWQTVQKIEQTVFDATQKFDPDLIMDYPTTEAGIKYYKSSISSKEKCVLLAEIDRVPAGYLIGGEFKYPYRSVIYGEIEGLGVMPDFRRMGIGSELVKEFRKWCVEKGYGKIYVNTHFDDERAVSFYKKHGLIPTDIVLIGKV